MTTDALGGVWRYSLDLARGLDDAGVDVVLALLGPRPAVAPKKMDLIVTDLPLDWTAATPVDLARASAVLGQLACDVGADTVHLHAPALADAAWPVPVVAVAHSCVGTWWNAVCGGPLPDDLRWRSDATGRGLRRAGRVIAPSHAFAAALRHMYGPDLAIQVVYNGLDDTGGRSAPPEKKDNAALVAGRLWDRGKNIALLDRCAKKVAFPIRAAGALTGPNGEVAQFDHLDWLGTLDECQMARAYRRARIFVSAARYEPFGLAVLEAAQAGLALVLSDIPVFRELWDDAAAFIDPGDAPGCAAMLTSLMDDDRQCGELACRAAVHASRYPLGAMVEGTLAVHRSLCMA